MLPDEKRLIFQSTTIDNFSDKGCYSRRIDDKNRLIYNVSSDNDVRKTLIVSYSDQINKKLGYDNILNK